jgi:broad specificity phosphatase PhoE
MNKFVWVLLLLTSCKSTFYVIRHGEKVDNSANPSLSVLGQERAEDLKIELANKGITEIYSTDYLRTKNTAKPLANSRGLVTKIYAASPVDSMRVFVEKLKQMKGKNELIRA